MNIVIIEDEALVAEDLERSLRKLIGTSVNVIHLRSVKEGITHFKNADAPNLIFSDIQLGDGLSFEIFVTAPVTAPIIFCTAYDEYALDAFKANGIDYILKPFTIETLENAIEKYYNLKRQLSSDQALQYDALVRLLANRDTQTAASVLVYHQDKIIPVNITDVALFYLEHVVTHMLTFTGKIYYPNKNLDELERLSGNQFYRANRQFLVCRKTITDVSSFFSRKLSLNLNIPFTEKIIVSKNKASSFLKWLADS